MVKTCLRQKHRDVKSTLKVYLRKSTFAEGKIVQSEIESNDQESN